MAVSSLVPAASGPTLSEIQTAVSTYSKGPLDRTWTFLGQTRTGSTSSTHTITGLGGYKYLKFVSAGTHTPDGNFTLWLRVNSDTSGSYVTNAKYWYGTNGGAEGNVEMTSRFVLGAMGTSFSHTLFDIEFINPTQTNGKKLMNFNFNGFNGANWLLREGNGIWINDSAITSVTFLNSGGVLFADNGTNSGIYVFGAN